MKRTHGTSLAVLIVFAFASFVASAGETERPAPVAGGEWIRIGGVALEIDRDGRLVAPDEDQTARLRQSLRQMFGKDRVVSHEMQVEPSGTATLVLDERHAVFSIARIDEQGRVSTECVTGADRAVSRVADEASAHDTHEE